MPCTRRYSPKKSQPTGDGSWTCCNTLMCINLHENSLHPPPHSASGFPNALSRPPVSAKLSPVSPAASSPATEAPCSCSAQRPPSRISACGVCPKIRGCYQERFLPALDPTNAPPHCRQEGRFFHGYCAGHRYLPLFCFCFVSRGPCRFGRSDAPDTDASAGTCETLEKIVPPDRMRFPKARIVVRADSKFSGEAIPAWCKSRKKTSTKPSEWPGMRVWTHCLLVSKKFKAKGYDQDRAGRNVAGSRGQPLFDWLISSRT
jgi:hypothetical protein